jgi:hypothetical protein
VYKYSNIRVPSFGTYAQIIAPCKRPLSKRIIENFIDFTSDYEVSFCTCSVRHYVQISRCQFDLAYEISKSSVLECVKRWSGVEIPAIPNILKCLPE